MEAKTRAQKIVDMLNDQTIAETGPSATHARLDERAKQILLMRFVNDMTLDQVGQALGITRERVRQIEAKTIRAIRSQEDLRKRVLSLLAE